MTSRGVFVLVLLIVGCGSVSQDVPDAPSDMTPNVDDAAALGPFRNVQPVAELNTTGNEDDPTLTADQLEIFFTSTRAGGLGADDIWTSRRPSTSAPWGAPTLVTELSSPSRDLRPWISPDGLLLYFSSDRPGGAGG